MYTSDDYVYNLLGGRYKFSKNVGVIQPDGK
jgi:hypothetical protein